MITSLNTAIMNAEDKLVFLLIKNAINARKKAGVFVLHNKTYERIIYHITIGMSNVKKK